MLIGVPWQFQTAANFRLRDGMAMNFEKFAQRVIRPVVEAIIRFRPTAESRGQGGTGTRLRCRKQMRFDMHEAVGNWCGWNRFRRGTAANLYELGADDTEGPDDWR